jgi:hypothetical protein
MQNKQKLLSSAIDFFPLIELKNYNKKSNEGDECEFFVLTHYHSTEIYERRKKKHHPHQLKILIIKNRCLSRRGSYQKLHSILKY